MASDLGLWRGAALGRRGIEGKTIAAIARELHVDPKTTWQDLVKARCELRLGLHPSPLGKVLWPILEPRSFEGSGPLRTFFRKGG
jgi:hypothetical protein